MNPTLQAAGIHLLSAARAADPKAAPMSEARIAEVESYLGSALPDPWRAVLKRFGYGPSTARYENWPVTGSLSLCPNNAAEHQVETSDGQGIAAAGHVVIGYVEGVGDCIVIQPGDDDPSVVLHSHGGTDRPLGTLSTVLEQVASKLDERVRVKGGPLFADEAKPTKISPLALALDNVGHGGNPDEAHRLIDLGVDIEDTSLLRRVLRSVSNTHQIDMFIRLLDAGADPSKLGRDGMSAFHSACCGSMGADFVEAILERRSDIVDQPDADGRTGLMLTLGQGSQDVETLLYKAGADAACVDGSGTSLLVYLAKTCSTERITRGVKHGARAGYAELSENEHFWVVRAFQEAAGVGDEMGVLAFMELGVDVDEVTSALDSAVEGGHVACTRMLLDHGADPNPTLWRAALSAPPELMSALLDAGANVDFQTEDGWTALMVAAGAGRLPIVRILLTAGANLGLRDNKGRNALDEAEKERHTACVEAIREHRCHVRS